MTKRTRNYLSFVPLLAGLVILFLLLLYFIPSDWIESRQLRPVDILADIRTGNNGEVADSSSTLPIPEPPRLDTCRAGLTCIEDFSANGNALDRFWTALEAADSLKRPVRIAFFGDSFIEGDIFCGNLRGELQSRFGGKGVGMMPLSSQVAGFRQTVIHNFSGWTNYSLIDHKRNDLLGISGNVFVPGSNASVYYSGVKYLANLDTFQRVSIFYSLHSGSASLSYRINKQESQSGTLESSEHVQRYDINSENCGNVSIQFSNNGDLDLYGVSLEDTSGIIVDNYSMRGCSGWVLKNIPQQTLKDFNQLIQYDLIILQYGLNVMSANQQKYTTFTKEMSGAVRYLQECFPQANFLLLGVPDRSIHKDNAYVTMPSVYNMIAAQKTVCSETGISFWNIFEAMGGENSMVAFANASPPKANKDYTHLTSKGGAELAEKLFETIIYEKERYDKKKEYQLLLQKR